MGIPWEIHGNQFYQLTLNSERQLQSNNILLREKLSDLVEPRITNTMKDPDSKMDSITAHFQSLVDVKSEDKPKLFTSSAHVTTFFKQ